MILLIVCATFLSTLLGGLFALKLKDHLHLILGFSAGAIVAVAFFDLMPEALNLGGGRFDPATILSFTGLGFLAYLVLDRSVVLHGHADEHGGRCRQGRVGAGSLSVHSFLDGVGVGLAFHVSSTVGAVVAAAVLTHDFCDGINVVSLIYRDSGKVSSAVRWLVVDALAPVFGVLLTLLIAVPGEVLGLLLALFAGFFLYIGASDLIPESHHAHPVMWTTIMTVLGAGTLFAIIRLAGI